MVPLVLPLVKVVAGQSHCFGRPGQPALATPSMRRQIRIGLDYKGNIASRYVAAGVEGWPGDIW
jgi:hypothetical protein